ncbi:hypothetical protein D3C85_1273320 [compost metagenome]
MSNSLCIYCFISSTTDFIYDISGMLSFVKGVGTQMLIESKDEITEKSFVGINFLLFITSCKSFLFTPEI